VSLWSRQSIAVKLPVALALLLLIAFGAMTVAVYLQMRETVVGIASERLRQAADQMAGLLGQSSRQRIALLQALMRSPDLVGYMRSPDRARADVVRTAIRTYLGAAADIAGVELWDLSHTRLLVEGASFDEYPGARVDELTATYRSAKAPVFSKLDQEGQSLVTTIGGSVTDGETPVGFAVERRKLASAQPTVTMLTGLIGASATFLVGNADGSAWTDLSTDVQGPGPALNLSGLMEYERDGLPRRLARGAAWPLTPFVVLVEFPAAEVLAPADRFLFRATGIGLVVILIAAGVGFVFSRRITTPLRQVTEAAEAVADARPKVHVDFIRQDELGRLADSFNTMAERVEESRAQYVALVGELEHRVEHRTAELQAANRELEAFSYSVSHDLRAPLRAIAGFVQILEEDHGDKLGPEATRTIGVVKRNTVRMGQLIDDLLGFARLSRMPLNFAPVDMSSLTKGVVDDLAREKTARQIDITVDPLPSAVGERALIEQVMVNLVSNAVKFSRGRERAEIRIGASHNGETVYFVRDNGVGFDMKYAGKLFGVFQRLHQHENFEGTGVGLAIIHRIVTRHGGRVWAEGAVDQGATFYFTLPTEVPPA
jgi:signal transduction histidine kinase